MIRKTFADRRGSQRPELGLQAGSNLGFMGKHTKLSQSGTGPDEPSIGLAAARSTQSLGDPGAASAVANHVQPIAAMGLFMGQGRCRGRANMRHLLQRNPQLFPDLA